MNPQQYIYSQVEKNWEIFPYKTDYIIHLLFAHHPNPSDIMLKEKNDNYLINYVRDMSKQNEMFEYNKFSLNKNELFNYLDILNINNDHVSFSYNSKIFSTQVYFRGQKSVINKKGYITLRLLTRDYNFNEFNEKMNEYTLHDALKEKLPNINKVIENKIKI